MYSGLRKEQLAQDEHGGAKEQVRGKAGKNGERLAIIEARDDGVQQLQRQLDTCNRTPGRCAPDTIRDIEPELVRTQSDWRNFTAELDRARGEFEVRSRDASDYERCVASVYDEVYRTVETRVQVTS